jgi:hypothetical protein
MAHGALLKWMRRCDVIPDVHLLEVPIQDLVVLFQYFGEASSVELDKGPEFAELDVDADESFLERDAGIM